MTTIIDGIKIKINLSNTKPCQWGNGKHNHYKVKLSKGRKSHTFDFWDCVFNTVNDIFPDVEGILGCFTMDAFQGRESFEDFVEAIGDFSNAKKVWNNCQKSFEAAKRLGIEEETLEKWGQF